MTSVPKTRISKPVHKTWSFCPRCGTKSAKRPKNPFHCETCSYTHFFGPCAAVGAITTDLEGRVLLLVRGKDPGKGKYGLPGGFVDPGESVEEALRREVLEEVQLKVVEYHYLVSYPNEYVFCGAVLPVADMFFVITVESFEGMKVQDGEIAAWHFCHPTRRELSRMAFESNRKALTLYLKQSSS